MPKDYSSAYTLTENIGNNALAYAERFRIYGYSPKLTIASEIRGTLEDVKKGSAIAFEEVVRGEVISCRGLEHFVRIENTHTPPCIIFDNHNHALFYWIEAWKNGTIEPGCQLIHIDEHSDLWENTNILDLEKAQRESEYAWHFTNTECNVGNYIAPARACGLIGNMIRIENEFEIEHYQNYTPDTNSILNLDLDIFSPELAHIDEKKILQCIQNFIPKVRLITIATSPYFIEQERAIEKLGKIF